MKNYKKDINIMLILYTIIVVSTIFLIFSCDTQESKKEEQKTYINHEVLDSTYMLDNGMEVFIYKDTITGKSHEIIF